MLLSIPSPLGERECVFAHALYLHVRFRASGIQKSLDLDITWPPLQQPRMLILNPGPQVTQTPKLLAMPSPACLGA